MARSTFYYHTKRLGQPDGYDAIREHIRKIYHKHHGRYGYRRVTDQLHADGIDINHKTVQKLMVQMGLKAKRKKQRYCSYKGELGKIAPNVINRDFHADAPDQKWTTDVTQVKIKDRKMYLSPVLDMFNGEIISYVISDSPDLKMVMTMLDKAFKKRDIHGDLIFHSDQGWHYQHKRYQQALEDRHITQSMSRKGNCLDNAMMENFFGLMKNELLYLQEWDSIDQFKKALREYIRYVGENIQRIKYTITPTTLTIYIKYARTITGNAKRYEDDVHDLEMELGDTLTNHRGDTLSWPLWEMEQICARKYRKKQSYQGLIGYLKKTYDIDLTIKDY